MSEPTLMTAGLAYVRGKLGGEGRGRRGRLRAVAALVRLVAAAGENQGACDRDRTYRGCPGARGGRTTGGACGHFGFLRRMGGVADGRGPLPMGSANCLHSSGRREHTPSSVATSCDYGILPFGLDHSGGRSCQNRITGDPRTAPCPYIVTGPSAGIWHSGRKIFGEGRGADDPRRAARRRPSGSPMIVKGPLMVCPDAVP